MSLSERLEALKAPGSNIDPVRSPAPSGWEPGVKYEADGSRVVTLPPTPELADESSWAAAVEALGVSVPDGYRVRLVEAKYDPAAWTRDEEFRVHPQTNRAIKSPAITRPVWRYRFVIEVAPARIDVDDLMRAVKARKPVKTEATASASFVFIVGDLQIGKPDGDGSAGTVKRFYESLDRAVARYKVLRKRGSCGPVVLGFVGDCPEGTVSQGGNLIARLDLTLTEQIRVLRRIFADEVAAFSDLTDDLTVVAVAGNHGEATRVGNQMATRYDDSWDLEALAQVADVMAAKGHDGIKWLFSGHDELHLTMEASGTRIGFLHGHQTRGKIQPWLANKALDRDPIGTADIVFAGHHHTLRIEHLSKTTFMQTGSLDGGSKWWTHKGGLTSPPAALTLVTQDGLWSQLEVV